MDMLTLIAATAEQIEADWSSEFFGLDQQQRFVLLLVALLCATAITISLITIVSRLIGSLHRRRAEGQLKRELIDRGMGAEEVVRIVEAAPPQDWLERWVTSQKKK